MQQEGLTCREKSSFERPCSQSGFRIQTKRRRNCRVRFQRCWCGGSDGRGWSVRLKGASKGSHLTTSNAKTVPTCDQQRDALPVRELRSALGALCSPCCRGNVCVVLQVNIGNKNQRRITFGGACIFSSTEACRVSGTCQKHNGFRVSGGSMLRSCCGGLWGSFMQYLENCRVVTRGLWGSE